MHALEGAATCGIGHVRILTEYNEHLPFLQDIRIEAVRDHLSVYYDPDARRLTKEDGAFCFVSGTMTEAKFKKKYPKAKLADFDTQDVTDMRRDPLSVGHKGSGSRCGDVPPRSGFEKGR